MAKIETRAFKSKKQLLVIAETDQERQSLYAIAGRNTPARLEGELVFGGNLEVYLRFTRKETVKIKA